MSRTYSDSAITEVCTSAEMNARWYRAIIPERCVCDGIQMHSCLIDYYQEVEKGGYSADPKYIRES